ncbi:hypothetical protein BLS_000228 [Venturia inaequalis]|uniref:Uncharacterized protein n=1 Tax=Venturia inaequalis TaxID=5025 RepID=A0A8H3Z309_VENIN|nr:hypothetical protein BLS_000228 [Venturia inaequalis]
MFSNSPKSLVHLPRPPVRPVDQHLPRGECRFIMPEAGADGIKQRCPCDAFNVNDAVPGSRCGCGHQAWHHKDQQAVEFVPAAEHFAVVDRCRTLEEGMRRLQDELNKEKKERDRAYQNLVQMLRGNYGNMAYIKYYVDEKLEMARVNFEDKIEGALDRATDALTEVDRLKTRVSDLDETSMRLEERLDSGRFPSRSLTPVLEDHPRTPARKPPPTPTAALPVRSKSKEKIVESWDVRVLLIPKKTQHFAFGVESKAYARCQSRGLHQDLHLEDKDGVSFVKSVESAFATILKGRPWMPLQCLRSSDMSLGQLHLNHRNPVLWDYSFLEAQCMAHDKAHGDVIYIALMHEELGWPDIHSLPRLFGSDESCWNPDDELDRRERAPHDMKMDMDLDRSKTLETDSMYEYSPPPYSSARAHGDSNRPPTALEVLAGTATYFADRHPAPSVSDRSTFSDRSIDSTIYEEDDEHRDKRSRSGPLRPQPQPHPLSPHQLSPGPSSPPQKMYSSGRTKRKINVIKQKEPLNWGVSDMKFGNHMKSVFHRKHSDSVNSKESLEHEFAQHHQLQDQEIMGA